ncbi:MAG: amidohydrolase family protein [Acidobacteria bacterium]|nr:amidohydrolase family protein [Acidobacteriota bacterium]
MLRKNFASWMFMIGLGVLSGLSQAQQTSLPPELVAYPDLVLHNGKIITADDQASVVSAVAIRDGKFLAVGENDRILKLVGPKTQKIDLQGKSVVPGFIDTHLHQAFAGQVSKRGSSGRVTFKDKKSGLEEIKRLVEATPPGEWVTLAVPRNPAFFSVTRKDVDPVSPNNPLVMTTVGADTTVNTAALNAAKIPLDTPGLGKDPQTGELTGKLEGWAAGIMLYEAKPWPPFQELIPQQKEMFARANAEGLTTIVARAQGLSVSVFRELWLRKELTARVRATHEFLRMNPYGEAYLKRLGNLAGFGDEWFKIVGTTVGPVDGADFEGASLTAKGRLRSLEDSAFGSFGQNKWLGHGYGHKTSNDWDQVSDEVRERTEWKNILLANRYGWNVTSVHSAGDESTRITLKAYEAANKEKPLEGRWGVDHQPMQTPETTALMKQLNVVPSFYYFTPGGAGIEDMLYQYGADRVSDMVPVKTFLKEGILPTYEADTLQYPFYAPMYNIEMFVTRKNPQAKQADRVFGAHEKLSRMEALYLCTKWAARYSGEEAILGTIEPGKLADLAVLDGDFFAVPDDEIFEKLPVVMTIVGGKVVYQTAQKAPTNKPERRQF